MRRIMITVAASVVAFTAGTMSPSSAVARNAATEAFWKCPTGFAFETNGSAVHCKKAAYIDQRPLGKCPLGLYPATDRIGEKDTCSATNALTGELGVDRACTAPDVVLGYTKRIVHGTDYCGKSKPAELLPPTVMVSL
jgi:hypothetical protein